MLLAGCGPAPWNNPHPPEAAAGNNTFSSFAERPKHLDPARSYSSNEWAFISQIYEPPLQYHFLRRPYELVPLTLEAMPEITLRAKDGQALPSDTPAAEVAFTDYRLHVRRGIRYQPHPAFARDADGGWRYWPAEPALLDRVRRLADFPQTDSRELVAADYAYQIKRLAMPANHSPIAGVMGKHILGFADYAATVTAAAPDADAWIDLRAHPLAGVTVNDRYTLTIRLEGVYPQFIYWLAMNFFAPMPWEVERFYAQPGLAERNIKLDWYPVGTGPYMLTENNPNLRMVLERNPYFRGEPYPQDGEPGDAAAGLLRDAGQAMPFIDRAVYSLEKEAIPRWNKFLQGFYDSSGISSDSFDQVIQFGAGGEPALTPEMQTRGVTLNTAVETSIFYLGFNMLDPVVGGDSERARLLRRAISIALDMEEFVAIFRNGRGLPAQGPLPPGIFGHREGEPGINPHVYRWNGQAAERRSLAEARELLAQAGYPGGRDPQTGAPLLLNYDNAATGPESKALMNWYRKQLDGLGIQLVIRSTDYNRFQEKMRNGSAQIFSWGWNADYPDPENFLFLLYGPNGKVEHRGENAANYANPAFDRLFEQMKNLPNGPQRQALIDRMVEMVQRDAPWVWGFYPKAFGLHHAWYRNTKPHLMANNTLKYRAVDGPLRERQQQAWNPPVLWPLGVLAGALVLVTLPAVRTFRRRQRGTAR